MRKTQTRARRRGIYVLASIIAIAAIIGAVGWYLYAQAQANAPSAIMYAKISTSQGVIEVELYQSKTPKTVANFISLANSGFYNQLVWHRIVTGFVIQTGDPNSRGAVNSTRDTWGQGNGPQTIPLELDPSLHNDRGYLAMARGDSINSASCQFFINLVDNRFLDTSGGGYAVFGKVISGMGAVDAIGSLPTENITPRGGGSPTPEPIDLTQAMMLNVTISNSP